MNTAVKAARAKKSHKVKKAASRAGEKERAAVRDSRQGPAAPSGSMRPSLQTVSNVVLPVRKPGEEAPRPGASGREFEDENELEEFDPLFDEVREERD